MAPRAPSHTACEAVDLCSAICPEVIGECRVPKNITRRSADFQTPPRGAFHSRIATPMQSDHENSAEGDLETIPKQPQNSPEATSARAGASKIVKLDEHVNLY